MSGTVKSRFFKPSGKQKMVRIIAMFENSGVKLKCLTRERKSVQVRIIRRFEKPRFREIWVNNNNVATRRCLLQVFIFSPMQCLLLRLQQAHFMLRKKVFQLFFMLNWQKLKYGYHCFKRVIVVKKTSKNVEMLSQNRRVTLLAEPTSCFSCERFVNF